MGTYEVVWAKGIEKDFKKLNFGQERFKKLVEKINCILSNPYKYTKQVHSLQKVRRFRFGEYRLFVLIDDVGMNIYCLSISLRGKSYTKESMRKILARIQKL